MIMPTKHTSLDQSLLGFGAYILNVLDECSSIDSLWRRYLSDYDSGIYTAKQSFDNLLLTLVFLYSINAIVENDGEISKCS